MILKLGKSCAVLFSALAYHSRPLLYKPRFKMCSINQSKYFRPKVPVEDFLNNHNVDFKEGPEHYRLRECPFCTKPHRNELSNLYTLNIHKVQGVYFCFRCSSKGSWLDYKKKIFGIEVNPMVDQRESWGSNGTQPSGLNSKIAEAEYFIYRDNFDRPEYKEIKDYLLSRGLQERTLVKYNLGVGLEKFYLGESEEYAVPAVYLPMYRLVSEKELRQKPDSCLTEMVKVKVRGSGKENKKFMKQYPSGSQKGFFGLNTVEKGAQTVIITEGEYDAMAAYQVSGIPAISLPQGAGNLPDNLLPMLDQFTKIILWMDNDEAGKFNEEKIAYKLGVARTCIIRNNHKDCKDANDCLKKDPNIINTLIAEAKCIPDQHVLKFASLKEIVKNRIFRMEENMGCKIKWFKFFNRTVKGIRLGELTVMSGPTGSGKTTLLSQMSVQMAKMGIAVLWGSFEIRNEVLITGMLSQFSGINLSRNTDKFQYFADNFAELPLYYLAFHGSNQIEKVLSTIIYSIEKYNVSLVVLDTLQFLLSGQGQGYKKFQIQDSLMSSLRKITVDYNVHIVIVIHPRKTEDGEDIGIHSIYGTSKATQEADNIWVVQAREHYKVFDIKKNRFDGEVGKAALGFNRDCKSFFQFTKSELQKIFNRESTVEEIIQARSEQVEQIGVNQTENEAIDSKYLNKKPKQNRF